MDDSKENNAMETDDNNLTEIENSKKESENNIIETEKNNTETENDNKEIEEKITELEKNNTETENNNKEIEEKITELENNITETENNITEIENNIIETENNIIETENNITEIENDITETENDTTEMENNTTEMENDTTEMDNDITTKSENTETEKNKKLKTNKNSGKKAYNNKPVTPKKSSKLSTDQSTPARFRNDTYQDDDADTPEGWKRIAVQRQTGVSAGKYDIYYISPLGKKLRSRNEVLAYCGKNNLEVDIENFKFKGGKTPNAAASLKKVTLKKSPTIKKQVAKPKIQKIKSPNTVSDIIKKTKPKLGKNLFKINSDGLTKVKLKSSSNWVPPRSPFNLFQEDLFDKPWQLLVGTILLNKTGEENVEPDTLWSFLKQWPTPEAIIRVTSSEIVDSLKGVPNKEKKAKMILKFSEEFLMKEWLYPKELHGVGKFGNDSYRVFCINEWKKVKPSDYLLNFYVDWLWDNYQVLRIH